MKKLQKINIKGASPLSPEQMRTIKGGNLQFICYCGPEGAPTSSIVPINAPDECTAHEIMTVICGGESTCVNIY